MIRIILVQRPYGAKVLHFASSGTVGSSPSSRCLGVAAAREHLRIVNLCLPRLPGIFPAFLLISAQCNVVY